MKSEDTDALISYRMARSKESIQARDIRGIRYKTVGKVRVLLFAEPDA